MSTPILIERWMDHFPALGNMNPEHLDTAREAVRFAELASGEVAYHQGWECPNYVMCVQGKTRVFKSSGLGREILIYRVSAGETCVLTTSCLLAGGTFPAESVAETPARLACLPAKTFHHLMMASPPFRRFVLDDYARLLNSMISLIDEVTFNSLDERLARRLLAEADTQGAVLKTHKQLALDLGSVREVVSRYLGEWERAGWIRTTRGKIQIVSKADLASYRGKTSTSDELTRYLHRMRKVMASAFCFPQYSRPLIRVAAIAVVIGASGLAPAEAARSVDQKICRELAQGYAQIQTGANTLQVNRMLFAATRRGCEGLAKQLLADGASLKARDRSGAMPLSRAAEEGWIALVKLYLDRGAPINSRDVYGSTALFRAAEADRLEIVRLLLDHGADVHIRGRKGNSVIAAAAYMGSPEMVQLLLKGGADPMLIDQFGKSPMSYATGRGFTEVVRVLLDGGVDVNARYGNGLTALMWAAGHSADAGYLDALEVMELLISRGARIDDKDNRGRTALMIAAELDHDEVVEALLGHGADVNLVDNEGKSASELASSNTLRERLARSN